MMAPFGRFDTSDDGQSIVRLAPEKSKLLFESVIDDDVQSYIDRYPQRGPEGRQVDRLTPTAASSRHTRRHVWRNARTVSHATTS